MPQYLIDTDAVPPTITDVTPPPPPPEPVDFGSPVVEFGPDPSEPGHVVFHVSRSGGSDGRIWLADAEDGPWELFGTYDYTNGFITRETLPATGRKWLKADQGDAPNFGPPTVASAEPSPT